MDEEQKLQDKSANGEARHPVPGSSTIKDSVDEEVANNVKNQKNSIYAQSFAGFACLMLIFILFFYVANEENWYKMTSSCGHTAWMGFFLFGVPLFAGAIAFEAFALSRRRNLLSISFLIIIVMSVVVLLMIYSNMNSTASGC